MYRLSLDIYVVYQHGPESIKIVPKIMLNHCRILYRNPDYSGGKVRPTQFQKMYLIE